MNTASQRWSPLAVTNIASSHCLLLEVANASSSQCLSLAVTNIVFISSGEQWLAVISDHCQSLLTAANEYNQCFLTAHLKFVPDEKVNIDYW